VFRQQVADPGAGRRRRQGVGVDPQVGDFRVQRRTRFGERAQHRFAVAACQQWPRAVARQPGELPRHADVEVHHETAFAHQAAVAGIEHRASAGGDELRSARQQVGQHGALARAEAGFALAFEDRRHAGAGARLDLAVRVHERQAEAAGQAPADRGLAGAHRAHQHEVRSGFHAAMLAGWRDLNATRAKVPVPRHWRIAGAMPWPSPRSSNSTRRRRPASRTR
jgi:hypothetical protein